MMKLLIEKETKWLKHVRENVIIKYAKAIYEKYINV
jgi:hypothetical protein